MNAQELLEEIGRDKIIEAMAQETENPQHNALSLAFAAYRYIEENSHGYKIRLENTYDGYDVSIAETVVLSVYVDYGTGEIEADWATRRRVSSRFHP